MRFSFTKNLPDLIGETFECRLADRSTAAPDNGGHAPE